MGELSDVTDWFEKTCTINKMNDNKYINCPFCGEDDFDLLGLKHHLSYGWCEKYNNLRDKEDENI